MPHATNSINGSAPASKFLSHVSSYPVVSDGLETFKQNPLGKKSLELAEGAYHRFAKPVEPYLETPLSYAKPYAQKADELAVSGLGRVETHFPIVKEDTSTVIDSAKSLVFWPLTLAVHGKDYVFQTWNDEYSKTVKHNSRRPGLTTTGLALISTQLKLSSDFFQAVADFLGPKYEESKAKSAAYLHAGQEKVAEYQKLGHDKANEYQKLGQDKLDDLAKAGSQKKEEIKSQALGAKEEVKKQVQGQAQK